MLNLDKKAVDSGARKVDWRQGGGKERQCNGEH